MANDIINGSNIGDAPDGNGTTFPAITLVNNRATITGSTGFAGDDGDIFTINAPARGLMTIRLTGLTSDLDLIFYDVSGNELDISWRYGISDEVIYFNVYSNWLGPTSYIEVYPVDGGSNYTLDVEFSTTPIPQELLGEFDRVNGYGVGDAGSSPYQSISTHWDSYGDIVAFGSTGYYTDSRDWYSFYPEQSGTVRLQLAGLDHDLDLYLINAAADTILEQSVNDGIANEEILFNVVMGEKYYVAIDNIEEGSNYQLTIDVPGQNERIIGPDIVNDEEFSDVSDIWQNAAQINYDQFGNARFSGATGFGQDSADWYYFHSLAEGEAELTVFDKDHGLLVELYNSNGDLLATTAVSTWPSHWIERDETYYIRVKALEGLTNYSIGVELPKPPPYSPDGGSNTTYDIDGTDGDDLISGFAGKNIIHTGGGDDRIWGGPLDDIIDGGDGVYYQDTILFYGFPDDYRYQNGVISGVEGNDTVTNIEFAGFGFNYSESDYEIRIPFSWLEDADGSGAKNSEATRIYNFSQDIFRYFNHRNPTDIEAFIEFREYASSLAYDGWKLVEGGEGDDYLADEDPKRGIFYGGPGDDILLSGELVSDVLIGGEGADVFKYTSDSDSRYYLVDNIKDYSPEDAILFEGMSGMTYYPGEFKDDWRYGITSNINQLENIQNQLVFFTQDSDGYLYVKGDGTGTGYDGTLIKLENILTAPTVLNVAPASELHIPEVDPGYKDLIEMYVAIAGRAPDAEGLNFWRNILDDGNTIEYVALQMWETEDAKAVYPRTLEPYEMVNSIYENVLDRSPDVEGRSYWVGRWNMNGPVNTMLEMISAINGYDGNEAYAIVARQLFLDKVEIGGYLAVTLESDDLALAKEAFVLLSEGNSIEATVLYLDQQLNTTSQVIGQSSVAGSEAMLA